MASQWLLDKMPYYNIKCTVVWNARIAFSIDTKRWQQAMHAASGHVL